MTKNTPTLQHLGNGIYRVNGVHRHLDGRYLIGEESMTRKTETLYGSGSLDGTTIDTTVASIHDALYEIYRSGLKDSRDILWDTLELSVDRDVAEDFSGFDVLARHSLTTIQASALGVKRG